MRFGNGRPHRRVPGWTYILVPTIGLVQREVVNYLRQASRAALMHEVKPPLMPVAPLLYLGFVLTEGELDQLYGNLSDLLLARTDRIWVLFPNGESDIDAKTYAVLDGNQRCGNRRPVYKLDTLGGDTVPVPMSREDVDSVLRANLSVGISGQFL